jgi:hypothetical protein
MDLTDDNLRTDDVLSIRRRALYALVFYAPFLSPGLLKEREGLKGRTG